MVGRRNRSATRLDGARISHKPPDFPAPTDLLRNPISRSHPPISQSSGVAVSQECLEAFQSLKLGKKLKFIIYTLSPDNREIVVAKTSTSTNYDDFLAELPAAECRYAIYDFEYEKGGDGKRSKICFYTW